MPLNRYYKGDGAQVMREMQARYGPAKGKSVFYATANAKGLAPKRKLKRKKKRK
jgi:hypothetical protein